jgi:hypothetical protein
VGHELEGHLGEGYLGDVQLVLGDQTEEQLERPLEDVEMDLEGLATRTPPGVRRLGVSRFGAATVESTSET